MSVHNPIHADFPSQPMEKAVGILVSWWRTLNGRGRNVADKLAQR